MADAPPQVGDRAQNAHGQIVTWDGHAWTQSAPPRATGGSSRQPDPQLAAMRSSADDAASVERILNRVRDANRRLQPGPTRGTFLDAAISGDDDSILGRIGGVTLGPLARLTGAISQQNVDDYQAMTQARNQAILHEQSRQHGVQTEGDAARMALAGVNIHNTPETNERVIDQGVQDAIRGQARSTFYTTWASRYGSLTAPNEQGAGVDEVWNHNQPHIINQFLQMRRGTNTGQPAPARAPTITRIR